MVLTYDGTNVHFFLNFGTVDANSRDSGAIVVDTEGLNIGKASRPGYVAGQGGSEYFQGQIDEVQIFTAFADLNAVQDLFAGGSGGRRRRAV